MQTILFVDDEKNIVKSLQRMVRAQGIECQTAEACGAGEALEILQSQPVDLVISDIRMPGTDGVELLTRLRATARFQHLPVIMLTGETDNSVRNAALGMGATDYLSKPVDPHELTARVRNALRLKRYQDELLDQRQRLQEQLEHAQRLELAGLVAVQAVHDLRNAISGILGSAEVMKAREVDDSQASSGLDRIIASARYAADISGHVLQAARTGAGKGTNEPVDLCSAVDNCVQMLSAGTPPEVRILWSHPGRMVMVTACRTEVMQAIMNLLTNGVQAVGDQGAVEIDVRPDPDDHTVMLTVSDNGPGLDESAAASVFEPFVTTKAPGEGTGLGLATVKRVIERYGGSVGVTSGPGRGTTFTVQLPIAAGVGSLPTP